MFNENALQALVPQLNEQLGNQAPEQILGWALSGDFKVVVTSNFRPYEAVLLHLCTRLKPGITVVWVDHGFNTPATYRHAQELKRLLKLNLKVYTPTVTVTRWHALHGEISTEEAARAEFSAVMKLEPFHRAMEELKPDIWITGLRKFQSPSRERLDVFGFDARLGLLKVNPVFYFSDEQMEAYLHDHNLPIEWDYVDPAKGGAHSECGLHVAGDALSPLSAVQPASL